MGIDVVLLGLRIDGHEQDVVAPCDVVDHAVATAGAPFKVNISNTHFVDRVADALDPIAWRIASLSSVDERLQICRDLSVFARKAFELALEGVGVTNNQPVNTY